MVIELEVLFGSDTFWEARTWVNNDSCNTDYGAVVYFCMETSVDIHLLNQELYISH